MGQTEFTMSRRYDSRTTIFSPDGRLYQVEYAMEAIGHAGAALGVLATDGVVLAAEKIVTSKLLEVDKTSEKMYMVDENIACAVAGIRADANILVNKARLIAQQYQFKYQEPMPVEQLIEQICDLKQGYTQFGGMRPFGVSFLFAGYDKHFGFQMYQSDPSGNYGGWKAYAIGQNSTSLTADKLEFATLSKDGYHLLTEPELLKLLEEADLEAASASSKMERVVHFFFFLATTFSTTPC